MIALLLAVVIGTASPDSEGIVDGIPVTGVPPGGAIDTGIRSAEARWGPTPCLLQVEYRSLKAYGDGTAIGLAYPSRCLMVVDNGLDWQERCAVAKHEAGHILGQPHSSNPRDIMYPQLNIIPRACRRGTGFAHSARRDGRVLFHGHRNQLP